MALTVVRDHFGQPNDNEVSGQRGRVVSDTRGQSGERTNRREIAEGAISVQIDFPPEMAENFEFLMDAGGVDDKRDLVSDAMNLLVWAVGEATKRRSVASIGDDQSVASVVRLRILDAARQNGANYYHND